MSAKSPTFLCIGSATQDVFLSHTPALKPVRENPLAEFEEFRLGSKINVNKIDFATGGGASDAATTFARHGYETLFMGTVGHDPAGSAVLESFDREGIDTTFASYSDKYNTDYSTILLAPSGERTILTYRGCGLHLHQTDFDVAKVFANRTIDWIYITGLAGHWLIYDEIFRLARDNRVKIAWNPSSYELADPDKLRALLSDAEVISVNREEAAQIVSGNSSEELMRHLRNFCPVAIVTDSENGAVCGDKTSVAQLGLYGNEKPVDATGAGDAFASGFVAKYATGAGLRESAHFAAANASSVVHYIGAKTGILTGREELHDMKIDIKPANY